jgi:hypothetical protein
MHHVDCVIQFSQPEQPSNRLVRSGPERLPEHDMLIRQGVRGVAVTVWQGSERKDPEQRVPSPEVRTSVVP